LGPLLDIVTEKLVLEPTFTPTFETELKLAPIVVPIKNLI